MSEQWNHIMCDFCWMQRRPYDKPVRVSMDGAELCCFCNHLTTSGIYVRESPQSKKLLCRSIHVTIPLWLARNSLELLRLSHHIALHVLQRYHDQYKTDVELGELIDNILAITNQQYGLKQEEKDG